MTVQTNRKLESWNLRIIAVLSQVTDIFSIVGTVKDHVMS